MTISKNIFVLIVSSIAIIISILIVFILIPYLNNQTIQIIHIDHFNDQDPFWYWRTDGAGEYSINNNILELKILDNCNDSDYTNAEIYDIPSHFQYKNIEMQVKSSNIVNDSRGWGFWNGQMDPNLSEFI